MGWREKQAERERQELHRLNAVRASLEHRQGDVASAVVETCNALADASHVSAAELRTTAAFLASLRSSERQLQALHTHCQSEIQAQTKRCVSADSDFRLLVKLRDQRLSAWQYEYDREGEQTATEVWQAGQTRSGGK